jgi:hypothetical protein
LRLHIAVQAQKERSQQKYVPDFFHLKFSC